MKQEKVWDYYQSEGTTIFDAGYLRLHFLASKCKKGEKVLNIGVGGGVFEKIAFHKKIDVYSLDPSEDAIANVQRVLGAEKAKSGFADAIPFDDDFFDVVVMSEVLEHLDAKILGKTLQEVYRVLHVEGRFIGTVPNDEVLNESIVVCPDCEQDFVVF